MTEPLTINPQTKISAMLDAYPQLEEVLIQQAPAFKKLQNPILRKTVARLATLETAAGMAGISVQQLVTTLRQAVGQKAETFDTASGNDPQTGEKPPWVDQTITIQTIDGDQLISRGQTPLPAVVEATRQLTTGQSLLLKTSFKPNPLIEALHKQNLQIYSATVSPREFHTYITPQS